jgi:dTMP kinase
MRKTLWIVVTGLDGSGKTSLVTNLTNWLTETKKLAVKRDRFPHDRYLVSTLLNKSVDPYTDRLLFALDNRLFGTELKTIISSGEYDVVITQRGFLDSFVHGSVQGYSYSWIAELNRIADLPRCDVMIHMVCEAQTAYSRISNDPDADKFEYPAYMDIQERETRRAYAAVESGTDSNLEHFCNAKNIYIDTTQMSINEVFELAKSKLESLNIL